MQQFVYKGKFVKIFSLNSFITIKYIIYFFKVGYLTQNEARLNYFKIILLNLIKSMFYEKKTQYKCNKKCIKFIVVNFKIKGS